MSFTSPIRPQPRAAGEPCSGLFGRASDQVCVANHNCTLQVHVEGCRCFFREFLGVVGTPDSPCSLREKNHTGGELPPEGWKIPGSVCGLCASWRLVADARMCHHGIQRDECTPIHLCPAAHGTAHDAAGAMSRDSHGGEGSLCRGFSRSDTRMRSHTSVTSTGVASVGRGRKTVTCIELPLRSM